MNIRALLLTGSCAVLACSAGINTGDDAPSTAHAGTSSIGVAGETVNAGGSSSATAGGSGRAGSANVGGSASAGVGTGTIGAGGSSAGTHAGGAASGGKGGTGGASGSGGSGATDQGGAPSGFTIDYSIWDLQIPTGDTIAWNALKAYSSSYFKKAGDGGQLFSDPSQGSSTGGSTHARTELREMKSGNGASWSPTGTNTLTVRGKAITCGDCTIGQIFHGDIATLAELQYSSSGGGTMKLLYEEVKGSAEPPKDLGVKIPLGETYTFVLSLSNNVLTVTVNGHVGYTRAPSSDVLTTEGFYFKAGNYDQDTTIGTVSNDVHSQIEDYSIVVVHQ